MTNPTADTTAAAESWLRTNQDLRFLLEEALYDPEIAKALAEGDIPLDDVRAVILEDPTVLARLRAARDWSSALRTARHGAGDWGRRGNRLRGFPPVVRILLAALVVLGYLVLLVVSSAAMPWFVELFCGLGLGAAVGAAVGMAGADARSVLSAMRNARESFRLMLDEVVLPELRQFIDERRRPGYGTTFSVRRLNNLYQESEDAPVIITAVGQRLRRILERSVSGVVAIAGHRGSGKTTMIGAVARGLFSDSSAAPPMHVIVSAPSRYEARDFVLHLHATLAKEVIRWTSRLQGERPPPDHEPGSDRRRRPRRVARWAVRRVVLPALAVGVAFLLWGESYQRFFTGVRDLAAAAFTGFPSNIPRLFTADTVDGAQQIAVYLLLLAALPVVDTVLGLALTISVWLLRTATDSRPTGSRAEYRRLRDLARHHLDRIRFLQTFTSGWSGKIGFPVGDAGWTRGIQRAEQNLTHPEVVAQFREFAGRAAAVLIGGGAAERLVIAVDELDKIAEPDKAHEFINDVKGIFGVEGCLFLVAVSDDAISAFEQRGIPVRDAFDSAFSEMVRVDPFTPAESRRWMARRLLGVPEAFSHLCHCLSGGLPRDLRRSTIDMIDAERETGRTDLASIAEAVVRRELDRKAHAFAAAARRLDDSAELTAYLTHLLLVDRAATPGELVELAQRLLPGPDSAFPRIRWQSACFVLFCATIREVFTNDLVVSELDEPAALLGTARAQLAVEPHVAWEVVRTVRTSHNLPTPTPS